MKITIETTEGAVYTFERIQGGGVQMTFKAGDQVKCIDARGCSLTDGEVYTVVYTFVRGDITYLNLGEKDVYVTETGWLADRFEIYDPELAAVLEDERKDAAELVSERNFRHGQELVCVHPGHMSSLVAGKTYIARMPGIKTTEVEGEGAIFSAGRFRAKPTPKPKTYILNLTEGEVEVLKYLEKHNAGWLQTGTLCKKIKAL